MRERAVYVCVICACVRHVHAGMRPPVRACVYARVHLRVWLPLCVYARARINIVRLCVAKP